MDDSTVKRPRLHPTTNDGEVRHVTAAGRGRVLGPKTKQVFLDFIEEAIEARAESVGMSRPQIWTISRAQSKYGLVVEIDDAKFQITLTQLS